MPKTEVTFPHEVPPPVWEVPLAEGNYRVTLILGGGAQPSEITIKAEARRLICLNLRTASGKTATVRCVVNIRCPEIPAAEPVKLKDRERHPRLHHNWDDRLTLEFLGTNVRVKKLVIEPAPRVPTLFLLGDSTVTDQPGEPYAAWGQMLPLFFGERLSIANHAESGESLRSSLRSRRVAKVLSQLRRGDWALCQFGHNDQKEKGEGVGALTTYKADLVQLVRDIRARGAQPVVVTSMYRRRFDASGQLYDTLGDYPKAVRQVAQEERVPLIDLHARSHTLFAALGQEGSKRAFLHTRTITDDTHFSSYGAYELARCVVEEIRRAAPALARKLTPGISRFDPSHPDVPESILIPPSPVISAPPDGS